MRYNRKIDVVKLAKKIAQQHATNEVNAEARKGYHEWVARQAKKN